MDEPLELFEPDPVEADPPALKMTPNQRVAIRELFAELSITGARDQFDTVANLTGTRIQSANDLDAATAHRVIAGLQRRLSEIGSSRTGNAWDDRDQDTWIDRM